MIAALMAALDLAKATLMLLQMSLLLANPQPVIAQNNYISVPSTTPALVVNLPQIEEIQPLPEVEKLMYCESRGQSVMVLDVNGKYSYGPLQFQSSTWNMWSKQSGIAGDPMIKNDAILMANWAIKQGYIHHWRNCAVKEGLLSK